jgi:hypothetical protein
MEKKVRIEYRTQQDRCSCCGHKLENPKTSEVRGFNISKDDCYAYLSEEYWKTEAEDDAELERMVEAFVHETIDFFALSSHEAINIDNSEIEKVKQFILENVIA